MDIRDTGKEKAQVWNAGPEPGQRICRWVAGGGRGAYALVSRTCREATRLWCSGRRTAATGFLVLLLAVAMGCTGTGARSELVTGGNPDQGAELMEDIGCGACHTIPGIPGAYSMVGPPLMDWSQRYYIAGALPNTPENLVLWIQSPQAIEPGTAMPDMGISEEAARDISAYLFTLGRER